MNPPFSEGRAEQHLDAAVSVLDLKGKIVALVTTSTAEKYKNDGVIKRVTPIAPSEFKGVSVDLAIIEMLRV